MIERLKAEPEDFLQAMNELEKPNKEILAEVKKKMKVFLDGYTPANPKEATKLKKKAKKLGLDAKNIKGTP